MSEYDIQEIAGRLAWDILTNETYRPVDRSGKACRENIHDAIVIAMYKGELQPLTEEIIDAALETVDEVLLQMRIQTKED